MKKPHQHTFSDGTGQTITCNKAGLFETLTLNQVPNITNIKYNEKGQRTNISYGNDYKNFRLICLLKTRTNRATCKLVCFRFGTKPVKFDLQ